MQGRSVAASLVLVLVLGGMPVLAVDSAEGKNFLADRHVKAGLTCESCHGKEAPGDVPMDKCLSCHGSYQELAKQTAGKQRNPHDSHYPDLECTTCHHGHRESEDFCATCHSAEQ